MIELQDLRLYQACPILYKNRAEVNLSDFSLYGSPRSEENQVVASLTELVKGAVLICARRMFTAERKYDRKKVESIWRSVFRSIFCPDEVVISDSLIKLYNQSLIILHALYSELDSLEGRIVGINLPLTVAIYGKQLDVNIPLAIKEDGGLTLIFFEEIWESSDGSIAHDPVIRFSSLAVAESVTKVSKIIVLGACETRGKTYRLGRLEFCPSEKYWQLACTDFAALATSLDQGLYYPNLRHCLNCPRKKTCEYPNLERND